MITNYSLCDVICPDLNFPAVLDLQDCVTHDLCDVFYYFDMLIPAEGRKLNFQRISWWFECDFVGDQFSAHTSVQVLSWCFGFRINLCGWEIKRGQIISESISNWSVVTDYFKVVWEGGLRNLTYPSLYLSLGSVLFTLENLAGRILTALVKKSSLPNAFEE